eukprot:CAMPEP_0170553150 /NCGR_PEP_ID=MMETSP0211-20121228/10975_1 /TAXON_ID=311385 /ORGANISM="Pseudokeronopsis sp., Strain OXSARD2" /LENGTH=127 /DNA_ID=CAMNT_0010861289 /DNA_START=225 /DNA_END=608 /DNA_ORIENTATION=-
MEHTQDSPNGKENREVNFRRERNEEDEEMKDVMDKNLGIDFQVKKISTQEEELLKKARDLENEMKAVRQAKMDVVVKQFEQQLIKDAQIEERRFTEELRDRYDSSVNELDAEKSVQVDEIEKLQKQL